MQIGSTGSTEIGSKLLGGTYIQAGNTNVRSSYVLFRLICDPNSST